jgi:hypothetical protein
MRQEIHQSPVATALDRRTLVLSDIVDRGAGLLIDERCKLLAVLGGPHLLVAALVTASSGMGSVALRRWATFSARCPSRTAYPQNAETYA